MSRLHWGDEKLFFRLMNNKSDKTYWDNIAVLRQRPTKTVFDRSVDLLRSQDSKFRVIGIDILAQLGITPRPFLDETLQIFFELLSIEKDQKVLRSLLYAIGHNNDKLSNRQIEDLCEFKSYKNSFVKEGLVSALYGVEKSKAISTLIELSEDKSASVRNWATFAIGSLAGNDTESIRQALWNRVNDSDPDTKFEAIAGLAKRHDDRIKKIISKELEGNFQSLLLRQFPTLTEQNTSPF